MRVSEMNRLLSRVTYEIRDLLVMRLRKSRLVAPHVMSQAAHVCQLSLSERGVVDSEIVNST